MPISIFHVGRVFILLGGIASITRNVAFVLTAFVREVSFFTRYFHTLNQSPRGG